MHLDCDAVCTITSTCICLLDITPNILIHVYDISHTNVLTIPLLTQNTNFFVSHSFKNAKHFIHDCHEQRHMLTNNIQLFVGTLDVNYRLASYNPLPHIGLHSLYRLIVDIPSRNCLVLRLPPILKSGTESVLSLLDSLHHDFGEYSWMSKLPNRHGSAGNSRPGSE